MGADTEAPVDPGAEAPAQSGEVEDPIKIIQKLTGKLAQKIRDTEQQLTDKDIKYILNSVISATNITKLSDEDKADIISKIEDKDTETGEEIPMSEYDNIYSGQDNTIARFTASGGQTVGENAINEQILSILQKARKNVKNNLKTRI